MEKVDLKTGSKMEVEKGLVDISKYVWHTRGQDIDRSLDKLESTKCVQEEPLPIYRPCSLSDSEKNKRELVGRNRNVAKRFCHRWILRAFIPNS